jgi:predicted flap endonuclease-1-like 5' DNA nuclease
MSKNENKKTKKQKNDIESSSSKSSLERRKKKRIDKNKQNVTKRKKIIIHSSSSETKETKETKENGHSKKDLKIYQDTKQMNKLPSEISNSGPSSGTHIELPSGRLNEKFIDIMEKLSDIMLKQGDPFRARAYQKAQETIMAYPDDILSPEQLKGKPNIGSTIMEKLNEYVQTGTLRILEREKTNPVNILAEVYGIGPKKAKDLVDKGITSIAELRANQELLNDVQKVGLKYYEDILERIPRSEIDEYNKLFKMTFDNFLEKPKKRKSKKFNPEIFIPNPAKDAELVDFIVIQFY